MKLSEIRQGNFEKGRAEMIRLSQELHGGEYAPTTMEYQRNKRPGTPARQDIFKWFGAWDRWCELCGLQSQGRVDPLVEYRQSKMTVRDALARAEMTRLSQELHGGEYAPNQSEYEQFRREDAASNVYICKHYLSWGNFADACGLPLASMSYYIAQSKKRKNEWDAVNHTSARELGRQRDIIEREGSQGLPCFDTPRQDTWRSVKDGKVYEGLAWLIR